MTRGKLGVKRIRQVEEVTRYSEEKILKKSKFALFLEVIIYIIIFRSQFFQHIN